MMAQESVPTCPTSCAKSSCPIDLNDNVQTIRVGSRKSKLALIQTDIVINLLKEQYGDAYSYSITSMTTIGDHILDQPLSQIGEKALFTRELEDALLDKKIDLIVHSLKDLPTTLPNGCCIGAILKREDPSDVLVLRKGLTLTNPLDIMTNEHSYGAIGTSSLRRISQLRHVNPSISVLDVRGNVNTRLSKLDDDNHKYGALILAGAGLKRCEFESRISHVLASPYWYHAVGQGALAIECRSDDVKTLTLLRPLMCQKTTLECIAERAFLKRLEGGCSVPIGVQCRWQVKRLLDEKDGEEGDGDKHGRGDSNTAIPKQEKTKHILNLHGVVFSLDGNQKVEHELSCDLNAVTTPIRVDPTSSTTSLHSSCDYANDINYTGIGITHFNDCSIDSDSKCPRIKHNNSDLERRMFYNSAKLGYQCANVVLKLGAEQILNDIKQCKVNSN